MLFFTLIYTQKKTRKSTMSFSILLVPFCPHFFVFCFTPKTFPVWILNSFQLLKASPTESSLESTWCSLERTLQWVILYTTSPPFKKKLFDNLNDFSFWVWNSLFYWFGQYLFLWRKYKKRHCWSYWVFYLMVYFVFSFLSSAPIILNPLILYI